MAESDKTSSKQKFTEAYISFVNQISADQFEDYKEYFAKEKDLDLAVQEFRKQLQTALLAKVNKLWDETDIDPNVELLEQIKAKAADNQVEMWRPTGKSVQEQVRPLVVKQLKMLLRFYQHQLLFQQERTAELICEIETLRAKYQEMRERRTNLLNQIAKEQQTFDAVSTHLRELDCKVNVDLEI